MPFTGARCDDKLSDSVATACGDLGPCQNGGQCKFVNFCDCPVSAGLHCATPSLELGVILAETWCVPIIKSSADLSSLPSAAEQTTLLCQDKTVVGEGEESGLLRSQDTPPLGRAVINTDSD